MDRLQSWWRSRRNKPILHPNRVIHVNDVGVGDASVVKGKHPQRDSKFMDNSVTTSRYTAYNFLPKFLAEQFSRAPNIYFLFICVLQTFPEISLTNGVPTTIIPLLAILSFDAAITAHEDYVRHRDDARANAQKALRLVKEKFEETTWLELRVGDIVKVFREQDFPADLLFLAAGHDEPEQRGLCHVQTAQLDGETNLKLRQAPDPVWPLFNADSDVAAWKRGLLVCEQPTEFFNRFNGSLYMDKSALSPQALEAAAAGVPFTRNDSVEGGQSESGDVFVGLRRHMSATAAQIGLNVDQGHEQGLDSDGAVTVGEGSHSRVDSLAAARMSDMGPCPLAASSTLLRGCVLKNVDYVYGLVIYTGNETKVRVKQAAASHKTAAVEKDINKAIVALFLFQFGLCTAGVVGYWLSGAQDDNVWYLGRGSLGLAGGSTPTGGGVDSTVGVGSGILRALSFFLLLSSLIPISLLVSMRLARVVQKWFMERDSEMVYTNEAAVAASQGETGVYPLRVRSMDLNDELGQITHLFSDKTGTLTSNFMEFRKMCVSGVAYGVGTTLVGLARRRRAGEDTRALEALLAHGEEEEKVRLARTPHVNFMDGVEEQEGRMLLGPDGDLYGQGAARNAEQAEHLRLFLVQLAVNHTVLVENVHDRITGEKIGTALSASSPDEEAFVLAGAFFGLKFVGRKRDIVTVEASPTLLQHSQLLDEGNINGGGELEEEQELRLQVHEGEAPLRPTRSEQGSSDSSPSRSPGGVQLRYRVLAILPYTQARKMMSVIVEDLQAPFSEEEEERMPASSYPGGLRPVGELGGVDAGEAVSPVGASPLPSVRSPASPLLRRVPTTTSIESENEGAEEEGSDVGSVVDAGLGAEIEWGMEGDTTDPQAEGRPAIAVHSPPKGRGLDVHGSTPIPGMALQRHRYLLLTKGADVKVMSRLRAVAMAQQEETQQREADPGPSEQELAEAEGSAGTQKAMQAWAADGLRTLAFAYKALTRRRLRSWLNKYTAAVGDLSARRAQDAGHSGNVLDALQDDMESDLLLLGATGTEDKLQDGVPETIEALSSAGIRLYMLTGDKQETALNIGFATRMLNEDFEQLIFTSEALAGADIGPAGSSAVPNAGASGGEQAAQADEAYLRARGGPHIRASIGPGMSISEDDQAQAPYMAQAEPKQREASGELTGECETIQESANVDKDTGKGIGDGGGRGACLAALGSDAPIPTWEASLPGLMLRKAEELARLAAQKRVPSRPLALVIDEPAIDILLQADPMVRAATVAVAESCRTVICCRCRPDQKKEIVQLIKIHVEGARTLAVGDGANDVDMILTSHVGVGIAGAEGVQAANASDYAIGRFRFLQRLLLVHGHWNYHRMSVLVLYMFWKNVVFALSQFPLIPLGGWSGQRFYADVLSQTFNLVVTSMPVLIAGTLDKDVSAAAAMAFPYLYTMGPAGARLNAVKVLAYILDGTLTAILLFLWAWLGLGFVSRLGASPYIFEWGTWLFNAVVIVVNIRIGMMMVEHSLIFVGVVLISVIALVPLNWLVDAMNSDNCSGCMQLLYGRAGYWAAYFVAIAVACTGVCTYMIIRRWCLPRYQDLINEWQVVLTPIPPNPTSYQKALTLGQKREARVWRPSAQQLLDLLTLQQHEGGVQEDERVQVAVVEEQFKVQHGREQEQRACQPSDGEGSPLAALQYGPLGLLLMHPHLLLRAHTRKEKERSRLHVCYLLLHRSLAVVRSVVACCLRGLRFCGSAFTQLLVAAHLRRPSPIRYDFAAAREGERGVLGDEQEALLRSTRDRDHTPPPRIVYLPEGRPASARVRTTTRACVRNLFLPVPAKEDVGQDLAEWPHAVHIVAKLQQLQAAGASDAEVEARRLSMLHARLLTMVETEEGVRAAQARLEAKAIEEAERIPPALLVREGMGGGEAATLPAPGTEEVEVEAEAIPGSLRGISREAEEEGAGVGVVGPALLRRRVTVPARPVSELGPPAPAAAIVSPSTAALARRRRWARAARSLADAQLLSERERAQERAGGEGAPGAPRRPAPHGRGASTSDFSVDTGSSMGMLAGLLSTAGRLSLSAAPATSGATPPWQYPGSGAGGFLPPGVAIVSGAGYGVPDRPRFNFGLERPPRTHARRRTGSTGMGAGMHARRATATGYPSASAANRQAMARAAAGLATSIRPSGPGAAGFPALPTVLPSIHGRVVSDLSRVSGGIGAGMAGLTATTTSAGIAPPISTESETGADDALEEAQSKQQQEQSEQK